MDKSLTEIQSHARAILELTNRVGLTTPVAPPSVTPVTMPVGGGTSTNTSIPPMAWGKRVSRTFRERVWWICHDPNEGLGMDHDDLMACMAWESGRSFAPDKRNMAGSGATGLIQFMPSTARQLGTTTDELAEMSAENQLNYVYKYFLPYKGRLKTLSDLYMAILWPKGVGKPEHYVLWDRTTSPKTYSQNAGLDSNRDGTITKAECSAKLYAMKAEGLRAENMA